MTYGGKEGQSLRNMYYIVLTVHLQQRSRKAPPKTRPGAASMHSLILGINSEKHSCIGRLITPP